jgi:hypothetical protein
MKVAPLRDLPNFSPRKIESMHNVGYTVRNVNGPGMEVDPAAVSSAIADAIGDPELTLARSIEPFDLTGVGPAEAALRQLLADFAAEALDAGGSGAATEAAHEDEAAPPADARLVVKFACLFDTGAGAWLARTMPSSIASSSSKASSM